MSRTSATEATSTKRETHSPDSLFLERQHTECQPAVRRMKSGLPAQPRRQRIELGACALDRDARFQCRDDVVVLAIPDLRRIGREQQQ